VKKMKYFICLVFVILLCAGGAMAAGTGEAQNGAVDVYRAQSEALDLDGLDSALSDDVKDALDGAGPETQIITPR
jgi:hypothetical protein